MKNREVYNYSIFIVKNTILYERDNKKNRK